MKKSKITRKRAVKDIDKSTKKSQIISHAAHLLQKRDFSDLSMEEVAQSAQIAKGTLYLYFQTKEELYLEVLKKDYEEWFKGLNDFLLKIKVIDKKILIHWIIDSLKERPRFLKMLPMSATILEQNVSESCVTEYKKLLSTLLTMVSDSLHRALRLNSPTEALQLLLQVHIVAVGAWSLGFPNPQVQSVIKNHHLHIFDLDYFGTLEKILLKLIE